MVPQDTKRHKSYYLLLRYELFALTASYLPVRVVLRATHGGCEKWKVVVSMRRTSLVLAVVAAMVTVLVFAAPAFAVAGAPGAPDLPDEALPAGPPEPSGPPSKDVDPKADTQAPTPTLGGLASEIVVDDATV